MALKCNIEKTCIMFIGPTDPDEADGIRRLGFTIVKSIKVLGFQIDDQAENLDLNFTLAEERIRKIIGIWTPFQLSMVGRISITKTFLVS